jgi:hypothetical protein
LEGEVTVKNFNNSVHANTATGPSVGAQAQSRATLTTTRYFRRDFIRPGAMARQGRILLLFPDHAGTHIPVGYIDEIQ